MTFTLSGLDGTNPLGLLAALGALSTLEAATQCSARLRWVRSHTWVAVLEGSPYLEEKEVSSVLAAALSGKKVTGDALEGQRKARGAWQAASRTMKKRRDELKKSRLGRAERELELRPLEEEERIRRGLFLQSLQDSVPRVELALGRRIGEGTVNHYRELANRLLQAGGHWCRHDLDHLAALGSDACLDEKGHLQPTPFEFTRGSGHQFFLEDVCKLHGEVTSEGVQEVLFRPWVYRDEGYSLRWDPNEDRRYALVAQDPSDEGARTVWMANLLAYRSLALFPTVPLPKLTTVGWNLQHSPPSLSWPIWQFPATADMVRTLLQLPEITVQHPDEGVLGARGVIAVYRTHRITVGTGGKAKVNFSPARQVMGLGVDAGMSTS